MFWIKFVAQQLVMFIAAVVGVVLLLPFCLFKQFKVGTSIRTLHAIDLWKYDWLNTVYGNPEDGVTGSQMGYKLNYPLWLRAYLWSAWRNSADELKYYFAAPAADYRTGTYSVFGRPQRWLVGYKDEDGYNVPVLHLWGTP